MSTPTTLRFRAMGTSHVPDHEMAETQKTNAFIGRRYMEAEPGRFGFFPTNEDYEVPVRAEYVKACADGCLFPADEATAAYCNVYATAHKLPPVVFDPHFGHPPPAKEEPKTEEPIAHPEIAAAIGTVSESASPATLEHPEAAPGDATPATDSPGH